MAADREMARKLAHPTRPGAARSLWSQQPHREVLTAIPRWAAPPPATAGPAPEAGRGAPHGPGRVLDSESRRDMEARFGHDFSRVRIHDDSLANSSAAAMGAAAYTVGHDIVLARHAPAPGDPRGQALLAHELAHVVQQERGGAVPRVGCHVPGERDAEAAARSVSSTAGPVQVGGATAVGVACAPAGSLDVTEPGSAAVSREGDVLLEPLPVSPPQVRVIGTYSDEQISTELYGLPSVPIRYTSAGTVQVYYGTLLPRWKPAFRESATGWERQGAEELERVGHRDQGGNIVWEDRLRWTPVTDSRRGGLVVGYERQSSGYTEVRDTAGEIVFVDEIPVEPVRIPLIDDIGDALRQAGYAAVGLADAWLEDNWRALGLPPHHEPLGSLLGIPPDATAYRIGRGAGHLVALLQAAGEMVSGAGLIVTGGGEFLAGIATTPVGGAGLVIMPVAVVTVGAGVTVVVHGGALAGAVFMSAMSGRGDGDEGGGEGGSRRQKDDLRQVKTRTWLPGSSLPPAGW